MQSPHLLWQCPGWPGMHYDAATIGEALARAKRAQGVVEGKLSALGFGEQQALAAEAWAQEAMATSAIEGEHLDLLAVRSSVARRLGVDVPKGPVTPRHVDGLLDIMDDAVRRAAQPLTDERLYGWQAALFPTGYSGMRPILVGRYRTNPMQIVSGPDGHETVHYEAPEADAVPGECVAPALHDLARRCAGACVPLSQATPSQPVRLAARDSRTTCSIRAISSSGKLAN